jgi:hypothetical protein|tara:strand:+ start:61 stop:213 length:153 start_codon:yes stop_codon:yes gene_type:complete
VQADTSDHINLPVVVPEQFVDDSHDVRTAAVAVDDASNAMITYFQEYDGT